MNLTFVIMMNFEQTKGSFHNLYSGFGTLGNPTQGDQGFDFLGASVDIASDGVTIRAGAIDETYASYEANGNHDDEPGYANVYHIVCGDWQQKGKLDGRKVGVISFLPNRALLWRESLKLQVGSGCRQRWTPTLRRRTSLAA